jgi:adenosylhomocysteine nucleosidase
LKHLIVMAMKEEAQNLFEDRGIGVFYTGLGKFNATYRLTKEIDRLTTAAQRPELVLNFGTAGSSRFNTHALVECTEFVQRDMDVTALGLAAGVTPFDKTPSLIRVERKFEWLESGKCGTGDSFETGTPKVACDIVDMEAYAYAKICLLEKIPFASVKYISDGSDHSAANDWNENLPKAAAAFVETYRRFMDT